VENVWALASLWVGLALVATLLAIWLKISTALSEIDELRVLAIPTRIRSRRLKCRHSGRK
jgi:hypothetical protein